jgi:hypothetical protein
LEWFSVKIKSLPNLGLLRVDAANHLLDLIYRGFHVQLWNMFGFGRRHVELASVFPAETSRVKKTRI